MFWFQASADKFGTEQETLHQEGYRCAEETAAPKAFPLCSVEQESQQPGTEVRQPVPEISATFEIRRKVLPTPLLETIERCELREKCLPRHQGLGMSHNGEVHNPAPTCSSGDVHCRWLGRVCKPLGSKAAVPPHQKWCYV